LLFSRKNRCKPFLEFCNTIRFKADIGESDNGECQVRRHGRPAESRLIGPPSTPSTNPRRSMGDASRGHWRRRRITSGMWSKADMAQLGRHVAG
jgi:hypothetical protein